MKQYVILDINLENEQDPTFRIVGGPRGLLECASAIRVIADSETFDCTEDVKGLDRLLTEHLHYDYDGTRLVHKKSFQTTIRVVIWPSFSPELKQVFYEGASHDLLRDVLTRTRPLVVASPPETTTQESMPWPINLTFAERNCFSALRGVKDFQFNREEVFLEVSLGDETEPDLSISGSRRGLRRLASALENLAAVNQELKHYRINGPERIRIQPGEFVLCQRSLPLEIGRLDDPRRGRDGGFLSYKAGRSFTRIVNALASTREERLRNGEQVVSWYTSDGDFMYRDEYEKRIAAGCTEVERRYLLGLK